MKFSHEVNSLSLRTICISISYATGCLAMIKTFLDTFGDFSIFTAISIMVSFRGSAFLVP